jgi:hypothetical protein
MISMGINTLTAREYYRSCRQYCDSCLGIRSRRVGQIAGKGVTKTIRQGLTLVSARSAYNRLRRLRDTVRLGLNVDDLRKDRN